MAGSFNPEWVGYCGAFFSITCYVPQVVKAIKEKHTKSMSLLMYVMNSLSVCCWLTYGWLLESPSIVFTNACLLLMMGAIISLKLKHG